MYALTVILKPSVCGELAPYLRKTLLAAQRTDGATFTAATWEVVDDVEALAAAHARSVVSDVVVATAPTLSPVKVEEVSVTEAAEILDRTRQSVLGRLARGSLPGRRDAHGQWWIARENLVEASANDRRHEVRDQVGP